MRRIFVVLLVAALGVSVQQYVLAADNRSSNAPSVSGTTWVGHDIWRKPISLYFAGDGTLTYKTSSGIWTTATWRQENNNIYFEINNRFVEHNGIIHGREMTGEGRSAKGYKGAWAVKLQSENLDALAQAKLPDARTTAAPLPLLSPADYAGTYEGGITFDVSSLTIKIQCTPGSSCEVETISIRDPAKPFKHIDRITNFSLVSDSTAVQRALQYARTNRLEKPTNAEHAAIQAKLRPLLDSSAVIDRCVDLNYGGRGASLLCRPSVSPWKEPVLLFFGASLGSCGQGFCEYVIYPLHKKLSEN